MKTVALANVLTFTMWHWESPQGLSFSVTALRKTRDNVGKETHLHSWVQIVGITPGNVLNCFLTLTNFCEMQIVREPLSWDCCED